MERKCNLLKVDAEELEKLRTALEHFTEPKYEDCVLISPGRIRVHPNKVVDSYFDYVVKLNKPIFDWELHAMKDMIRLDHEFCAEANQRQEMLKNQKESLEAGEYIERRVYEKKVGANLDDDEELRTAYDSVLELAERLDGFPFTFSRICELLSEPSRVYTRALKFYRALDKCLNVVSTVYFGTRNMKAQITKDGKRITGAPCDFAPVREEYGKIEQRFFGRDEVDEMDYIPNSDIYRDEPLDMSTHRDIEHRIINPIDSEIALISKILEDESLISAEELANLEHEVAPGDQPGTSSSSEGPSADQVCLVGLRAYLAWMFVE